MLELSDGLRVALDLPRVPVHSPSGGSPATNWGPELLQEALEERVHRFKHGSRRSSEAHTRRRVSPGGPASLDLCACLRNAPDSRSGRAPCSSTCQSTRVSEKSM